MPEYKPIIDLLTKEKEGRCYGHHQKVMEFKRKDQLEVDINYLVLAMFMNRLFRSKIG